jgi:SAM-dependent methyltransferase
MPKTKNQRVAFEPKKNRAFRLNAGSDISSPTAGRGFLSAQKFILDVCCGGKMFWFDADHPNALYVDKRVMKRQVIWRKDEDKRYFEVKPDAVMDFRKLDLPSDRFSLVVFDPPHLLKRNGKTGWMNKKYGSLGDNWREDIKKGFSECFRVLKKRGVLIFKWSESEIPLSEILKLASPPPLFGHKTSRQTVWVCFIKL